MTKLDVRFFRLVNGEELVAEYLGCECNDDDEVVGYFIRRPHSFVSAYDPMQQMTRIVLYPWLPSFTVEDEKDGLCIRFDDVLMYTGVTEEFTRQFQQTSNLKVRGTKPATFSMKTEPKKSRKKKVQESNVIPFPVNKIKRKFINKGPTDDGPPSAA